MKRTVKIVIGIAVVLICLALAGYGISFASGLKTQLLFVGLAAIIGLLGLVLGIFLSKPKWLKIVYSVLVLLVVAVSATGIIYGASVMSKINEGAVETVERLSETTAAPKPSVDILEGEPDSDSFDTELPDAEDEVETTQVPIYQKDQKNEDIINILVLGQDADHLYKGFGRSDVMLLLSYNREKNTIKMLSFMRDSYVPIEGHGWNRLNTCIRFGGPGLIINTLNDLFDLDIQLYVTLAFDEFKSLVDNIGGIDILISKAEARQCGAGWAGESTPTHMTGAQALSYVRNRSVGQGDFSRTERQRKFMLALYSKLRRNMNVDTMLELVSFSERQVRTNMSFADVASLALELIDGGEINIQQGRMPFDATWHYGGLKGASVISIDVEANKKQIHSFLYGE